MRLYIFVSSDTMGNKGAFVTLRGGDLKPNFTAYEAVVSSIIVQYLHVCPVWLHWNVFNQSINRRIYNVHSGWQIESNLRRGQPPGGWGGYTLRVVREVRWVFSRRLKVSNVFDSLITAGNSFQIVGAEKLKEHLPRLVVQKILTGWAETMRWLVHMKKISEVWWLVGWQLLYVRRAILYRPQPHLVEASLNFNICTNYRPLTSTLVWAQH